MIKYKIFRAIEEIKYSERGNIKSLAFWEQDTEPEEIAAFDTLEEAKKEAEKEIYRPKCNELGGNHPYFEVEEYGIVEIEIDEDGEELSYGDMWSAYEFKYEIMFEDIEIQDDFEKIIELARKLGFAKSQITRCTIAGSCGDMLSNKVYIFGNDENYDCNNFYQFAICKEEPERIYKLYYDTEGVELLEDIEWDYPDNIKDVTSEYIDII